MSGGPFRGFEEEWNKSEDRLADLKRRVHKLLEQLESDGHDFDGEQCPKCGIVDSEPCCPICLTHNGGKLGGVFKHTDDCALAAMLKECGG